MKLYSILAVFGFAFAVTSSGIAPDQTAEPTDSVPLPVPGEEQVPQQSTPTSRRERRKRTRRERDTESEDETNDQQSDESDL